MLGRELSPFKLTLPRFNKKPPTKENLELEATLSLELDDWLLKDELRLKQKSRELWLEEGD